MFGSFRRKKKAGAGESSTPAKNKYNAKKVEIDGLVFDSKLEGNRYIFLREAEARGEITNLQCHVEFELLPAMYRTEIKHLKTKDKEIQRLVQRKVVYTSDFAYNLPDGQYVVEDCKGSGKPMFASRDFPLRQKMMYYFHHIDVKVVTKASDPIGYK